MYHNLSLSHSPYLLNSNQFRILVFERMMMLGVNRILLKNIKIQKDELKGAQHQYPRNFSKSFYLFDNYLKYYSTVLYDISRAPSNPPLFIRSMQRCQATTNQQAIFVINFSELGISNQLNGSCVVLSFCRWMMMLVVQMVVL